MISGPPTANWLATVSWAMEAEMRSCAAELRIAEARLAGRKHYGEMNSKKYTSVILQIEFMANQLKSAAAEYAETTGRLWTQPLEQRPDMSPGTRTYRNRGELRD